MASKDYTSDPGERFKMALAAGGLTAALPWLMKPVVHWFRLVCGPGDAQALIWFPEPSWHASIPLFVGGILGVVVALLLGFYGRAATKVVLFNLCGLAVVVAAFAVFSLSTGLRVYPDRIDWFEANFPAPDQRITMPLAQASSVMVYCRMEYHRRRPDKAFLAYVVDFPGIGSVDLGDGKFTGKGGLGHKLDVLTRLNDGPLSYVRVLDAGSQDVDCVQRMRARFGRAKFAQAMALMRMSDETYLRNYARPDEAWSSKIR